jgi:hypothetical protein
MMLRAHKGTRGTARIQPNFGSSRPKGLPRVTMPSHDQAKNVIPANYLIQLFEKAYIGTSTSLSSAWDAL